MSTVKSGAAWVDQPESTRAIEMRARLIGIEQDLIALRRLRKNRVYEGLDCAEIDAQIGKLKQSDGRIRAHLRRGIYG